MLKPKDAAAVLNITEREVRDLCARGPDNGGIRAGKVGRHWRIHPDDLDAFIRSVSGLACAPQPFKATA